MSKESAKPPTPQWAGERYVPEIAGEIRLEHLHRYLIARELSPNKRVLDIACGEGYGSAMLASVASQVIGVDIASEVVAHASQRYARRNLKFRYGSCEAIPLDDSSVDLVVSFETIEHIDSHEEMMREIKRVLSPDGLLIISSPDRRQYLDALGNRNPYHKRELDREEFDRLLRTHFSHVAIGGQRVRGGSIVAPLDVSTKTRFVAFPSPEEGAVAVHGLDAPLYLLALASDQPVPALPVGLVDGGEFTWASDLGMYYARVQGYCAVEIGKRLGEVVQLDETSPNALQAEFNRQADRVSELSESIQTYHSLDAKVGILVEHVAAFSAQLEELNARLEEASAKLAAADAELVAVRAVAKAQATASEGAERKVRRLESELEAGKRSSQERESQFAERLARDVANHLAHIALLQEQVDIYERSHSWRLTAPIRAVRRKLGRSLHRGKTYVDRVSHGVEPQSKGSVTAAAPGPRPVSPKSELAADAIPPLLVEPSLERGDTPSGTLMVRLPDETAGDYVPLNRSVPVETRIKLIAFYLPQFHPIPENDAWWGRGFTEWTNVSRAKPQFVGHYQPHLPGELGFYDLRLVEVQQRQIELARLHGIHGFCFHHYWFGGTKLLRRPLDQFLDHPELDFPFCLCWANENWTRKWDGRDDDILIGQQHSPEDDLAFIRDIEPALRDPRYIRVDGRLLLTVYRPALLPDASATAERWRVYRREVGLGELFLVSTHAFDHRDPREFGFDAVTEFAPNNMAGVTIVSDITEINPDFRGVLYDYRELVATNCQRGVPAYPIFRCVTPMWDNEARRPFRGTVYAHSSPGLYRQWLQTVCGWAERHGGFDKPVVFVNAWNEWAEGAHLEPDQRYGYAYLEATAEALERFPIRTARASIV